LLSNCTGWLLDITIEQDKAILWIKTEDKKILRLVDLYQPFFYILPRNEYDGTYLFHVLSQQTDVKKVKWEENKSTDLFEKYSKRKLICVFPESVHSYATLLERLGKNSRVRQVFNTDLSHVQQYLFHRLKIEPTSKVEVKYDGSNLVKLVRIGDEDEISPPPFSILDITIETFSGKVGSEDSVAVIRSRYEYGNDTHKTVEISFNSKEEKDILEAFCSYVQVEDPDILVFEGNHYASTILDYLFARTETLGLSLHLGREKTKGIKYPGRNWIKGRLAFSSKVVGG
jgi:DNA polymerase elongation subunit (family B)